MENGRIGGMGEKSGEMMGLAVEIGRIGRVRWGVLIDFDHTSLNRVSFTRGIRLLPILPISTAKHNVEQPCLLSEFNRRHPCFLSEMVL